MAQRTEQIVITPSHPNHRACQTVCSLSRKLGNCAVYILRHKVINKEATPTRIELDQMLRSLYPEDYRAMPSAASAQRQGQVVSMQFKSFHRASAEFARHPEKFLGKPKLPGYSKRYRTFYVGRNGYKITDSLLTISGGEEIGFMPLPVRCCQNQVFNAPIKETVVGDVRIVPKGNSFVVELTYEVKDNQTETLLDKNQACILDLGVENFITIVSTRAGVKPILVKGGRLKSLNQKYNKDMAELRSLKKTKHFAGKSFKRERRIKDELHKMSRLVIEYCLLNDLGKLIIGKNTGWKQCVNMGTRNNQKFVYLPHSLFIDMVRYKAEELGIEVIAREESYTSKASALDFDELPVYGQEHSVIFSGKRIRRGLYRTASGSLLNADINGALNIGRKELGNEWLQKLLKVDEGVFLNAPAVIRQLHFASCRALLEAGPRSSKTSDVSPR